MSPILPVHSRSIHLPTMRRLLQIFLLPLLALLLSLSAPAQAAIPQIAAGYYHNVALKNDGTVWAWGYNGFGQLGNGSIVDSTTPVQVQGLNQVTAIAAGFFHTAALKSDGTVWVWGDNGDAQLGLGSSNLAQSSVPLQVAGLSNVVAIAASGAHMLALKSDGTVWVWGWNAYGQLGIGSVLNAGTPVRVPGLQGITGIAAGFFHSMALGNDGTTWAWGYNGHGQLGNGGTTDSTVPLPVLDNNGGRFGGVKALAAGGGHSLALKSDGTVWAWGWNGFGQLGNGSTTNTSLPRQVNGLSPVSRIASGFFHCLALQSDGALRAWGYNAFGQLGIGSSVDASAPSTVLQLTNAVSIAANNNHSIALKNDGSVWAWGWNDDGELGNGGHVSASVPVAVSGAGGQGLLNLGASTYQDLWNDPAQPGWGIGITQHGSTLFASWFTYDANGKPTWLVMPGGAWSSNGTIYTGSLYSTVGQNAGTPFTPGAVSVTPVGSASISFADAAHATLSYNVKGAGGNRALTRYVFDTSGNTQGGDHSDLWWTPSESGWGLSITQQSQTIFAGWYTYDAAGQPTWLVLPGGSWLNSSTYRGTLYRTVSSPTGIVLSQAQLVTTAVGTATLSFVDADHAVLSYGVDGVAGSKSITRLGF